MGTGYCIVSDGTITRFTEDFKFVFVNGDLAKLEAIPLLKDNVLESMDTPFQEGKADEFNKPFTSDPNSVKKGIKKSLNCELKIENVALPKKLVSKDEKSMDDTLKQWGYNETFGIKDLDDDDHDDS